MRIYPRSPLFAPVSGGGGNGSGNSGTGSTGGGTGASGGGVGSGGGGIGSGLRSGALLANGGIVTDPNIRRTDLNALHPSMRRSVLALLDRFAAEKLPFRVFEAYRSPSRQSWLYAQGRTSPGAKVTNAKAWESYHQHGLAADFVLWLNDKWSWSTVGIHQTYWKRLHVLGKEVGLEPLSFEAPHLQVAGLKLADLQKGQYPDGEDDLWRDNLEASVIAWNGAPAAPQLLSARPKLATAPTRRRG